MVRLRGLLFWNITTPLRVFQFLYGSIESHEVVIQKIKEEAFQFLYGSIERNILLHNCYLQNQISIPIWFDWEPQWNQLLAQQQHNFNSYMVRLRAQAMKCLSSPHIMHFNSYMVRLRDHLSHIRSILFLISIPIWFDWEEVVKLIPYKPLLFQFLYGSIERKLI